MGALICIRAVYLLYLGILPGHLEDKRLRSLVVASTAKTLKISAKNSVQNR